MDARRKNLGANYGQDKRLPRHLFDSRSKQCWLDVILQTYKCFVLRGIHKRKFWNGFSATGLSKRSTVYRESIISSTSRFVYTAIHVIPQIAFLIGYTFPSSPRQYELHESAIRNIANLPNRELTPDECCSEEKFLLAWLQYHYEQQRARDWMADRRVILNPRKKQDVAARRTIQNFHRDLSDGLVLIAVTVAYCPFLIDEHFSNLYICPKTKKEVI
ncbi:hypothetical protein P5V15_007773 [Pogonomyrmex californicus]